MSPQAHAVFLHGAGASAFDEAFIAILAFVLIFTLSFAFGNPPEGGRRLSGAWARSWLRASLLRLAVAGLFSTAVFFASAQFGGGGDGTSACDQPLPPLSAGPLTEEDFRIAELGADRVAELARQGNVNAASNWFFTQVHAFTHNVDQPLRAENDELAKGLCRAVLQIESELLSGGDAATIAEEAAVIGDLIRQAAAELGFDR